MGLWQYVDNGSCFHILVPLSLRPFVRAMGSLSESLCQCFPNWLQLRVQLWIPFNVREFCLTLVLQSKHKNQSHTTDVSRCKTEPSDYDPRPSATKLHWPWTLVCTYPQEILGLWRHRCSLLHWLAAAPSVHPGPVQTLTSDYLVPGTS